MKKVLTAEREAHGWSRSELARRAHMSPASVGQIEAGRLIAYVSQLEKLKKALGYKGAAGDLLEDVNDDVRV